MSSFVPSTAIDNSGNLMETNSSVGITTIQMWECAIETININECSPFGVISGNKANINLLAKNVTNKLINNSNLGVAIMVIDYLYCMDAKLNELKYDSVFKDYVEEDILAISRIRDLSAIENSISDGILDDNEINNLYFYYGFENQTDFNSYLLRENERLVSIQSKYSINKYARSRKKNLLNSLKNNLDNIYKTTDYKYLLNINSPSVSTESCYDDYKLDVTDAAAWAVLEHIACSTADVTVVIGILCHSAVLTIHMNAITRAKNKYFACLEQ